VSDTPRDQQPDDSGIEPVTGPPGGAPTAAEDPVGTRAPTGPAGPARAATGPAGPRAGAGPAGATRAGATPAGGSRSRGIGAWWRSLWGPASNSAPAARGGPGAGGGPAATGGRGAGGGPAATGGRGAGGGPSATGGRGAGGGLRWSSEPGAGGDAGPENDPALRRRRRWFIAGIAAAAALVVIALCAGTVAVVDTVGDLRDRTDDARDDRRARDGDCLALEERLNRLLPPGVTTTPQARAIAVRDENAAVRIYVAQVPDVRDQDGWRQLLDARTAYAEALDKQVKSRTPAFFVAPRTADGRAVADQLVRWSPAPCAGPIRRLAAPDL
jgi:hypothetical protein